MKVKNALTEFIDIYHPEDVQQLRQLIKKAVDDQQKEKNTGAAKALFRYLRSIYKMNYSLFVSCPKGLEYLLEEELKALGLHVTRVSPQGVYGEASLSTVYQLCLWSRIANRVQLDFV